MYIKLLLRLIFGYVRIEVEGYWVERFINICINNNLVIWNLKMEKGTKLYLNIGIQDFKYISKIAKKTRCKVRILKKRGIPFLLDKYKKRKIEAIRKLERTNLTYIEPHRVIFAIFFIIILILIYISSRYVWNVEIKGTNVKVSIVKADKAPEIIDSKECSNIIATKAGVITSITAQNGTAVVHMGDKVEKGDVLIAGYMQGKYTDTRYLHALGEVKATISYEKTKEFSYVEEEYYETGNKNKKYELSIGDKNFKLYKKLTKFEFYKTQKTENNLKFAKNFYLPIKITKLENYERIKETKKYSLEDSIKKATEQLEKEMQENIENKENIINKSVVTDPKENTVIVKLIYEVEENIGEDQRF